MKSLSIYTALIIFLLISKMSFASSILGSYTPSIQYFKVTSPTTVLTFFPTYSTNFLTDDGASCGIQCTAFDMLTTPDSAKGGQMTIEISSNNNTPACYTNFVLPLTVDTQGNIETNNTSYQIKMPSLCKMTPNTFTATVAGDPDSTNGYTISIQ